MKNTGTATLPERILELCAICGELPVEQMDRLIPSESYREKVITLLKSKNYFNTFYRDGLRGYRLTAQAKRMLLEQNPKRFGMYLTGGVETNLPRGEITRRLRLHRMASALITMQNASAAIFPDEKPALAPETEKSDWILAPSYYSSRELRELGAESMKVRNSRATGVLFYPSGAAIVYNTAHTLMKWNCKSELRLKAVVQHSLCRKLYLTGKAPSQIHGLLLADTMQMASQVLHSAGKGGYLLLDGSFEHFFFLSNDRFGEMTAKLLCFPEIVERLNRTLMQGLKPRTKIPLAECDAEDSEGNLVLFAYLFDLPRIVRFNAALMHQERPGVILCFDFQKQELEAYCCRQIKIQAIDTKKFEMRFLI